MGNMKVCLSPPEKETWLKTNLDGGEGDFKRPIEIQYVMCNIVVLMKLVMVKYCFKCLL